MYVQKYETSFYMELEPVPMLTYYSRLQVHKHGTRHVLASSGLAEKGVEGIISASNGLVCGHLAIRLDSMLQAVQLPAGISDLDSGLANVYWDALTLHKRN